MAGGLVSRAGPRAPRRQTDENYRLWYTDHALHGDTREQALEDSTRIINYVPILNQALRDLAAWVEGGVPPPASTSYRILDGQVIVAPTAAERNGVQPVVTLKANGGERAEVRVGQPVQLAGTIEVPPVAGSAIAAEWDFDGKGSFPASSRVPRGAKRVTVSMTHIFNNPGTYFPALRGTSHRQGDTRSQYARISNLGRVRVVVK